MLTMSSSLACAFWLSGRWGLMRTWSCQNNQQRRWSGGGGIRCPIVSARCWCWSNVVWAVQRPCSFSLTIVRCRGNLLNRINCHINYNLRQDVRRSQSLVNVHWSDVRCSDINVHLKRPDDLVACFVWVDKELHPTLTAELCLVAYKRSWWFARRRCQPVWLACASRQCK